MSERNNPIGPAIAGSLAAQRIFNHNILLALVENKVLTQQQAGSIAGKTADQIREVQLNEPAEAMLAKMADAFEQIAAAILGLKPPPQNPIP